MVITPFFFFSGATAVDQLPQGFGGSISFPPFYAFTGFTPAGEVVDEPTGQNDAVLGGKGDNDGLRRRRTIVKPTGLDHRRKLSPDGRKDVADRLEESRELAAEVAADAAFEFIDGAVQPIEIMSLAEIEQEIGMLLRKKLRTEEEDVLLLTLMAALAVA